MSNRKQRTRNRQPPDPKSVEVRARVLAMLAEHLHGSGPIDPSPYESARARRARKRAAIYGTEEGRAGDAAKRLVGLEERSGGFRRGELIANLRTGELSNAAWSSKSPPQSMPSRCMLSDLGALDYAALETRILAARSAPSMRSAAPHRILGKRADLLVIDEIWEKKK